MRLAPFRAALLVVISFLALAHSPELAKADSALQWQPWSENVFSEAKRRDSLILLNLEARWCHWCHVMEQQTYALPEIQSLLRKRFLLIKVDQDSHPELANRYRDFGWPATVIFRPDGVELAKRAGYIAPDEMRALLQSVGSLTTADPGAQVTATQISKAELLLDEVQKELLKRHIETFDFEKGGIKISQRFLDSDGMEFSLRQLAEKPRSPEQDTERKMAELTLTMNRKLFDPIWGGVYQYSTHGDWDHPHYEKIIPTQAKNLRIYSLASLVDPGQSYLMAANQIEQYLLTFLRAPDGSFYTSQDADLVPGKKADDYFLLSDAQRRKIGIPRIDTNRYARENGLVITALTKLYRAQPTTERLFNAERAFRWIEETRLQLKTGLPTHSGKDDPYLGDALACAEAALSLYEVTADRRYLTKAINFARIIISSYEADSGFVTAPKASISILKPVKSVDENIQAGRLFNLLAHYSGEARFRLAAESALRYLSEEALERVSEDGILLLIDELERDPLHVTVVGAKNNPEAVSLFHAALRLPTNYLRLEWFDSREGPLLNPDVEYPDLPRPAAFLCTQKRCSLPLFHGEEILAVYQKINGIQM